MLFSEEFNISRLYNVSLYAPGKKKLYKYPPSLPTHELMCCMEGEAEFNFNKQSIILSPGKLLYLPKGIDNDIYTISVLRHKLILHNIYFDTSNELPQSAVPFSPKSNKFPPLYEKLYRIWIEKRPGYYYSAMAEAYKIFKLVHTMQLNYLPNKKTDHLEVLDDYISEHYCDVSFNYHALPAMCGLSYSYFKKLFISKYGMPPVKYITGLKIKRASELLLTNMYSVSEIADMCGFENVYYFSNVFKKHAGVSPKNYSLLTPYID